MLRRGEVVAFPTETVYGLGADAQNESAVRRVFDIKGRPLGHPVIVHLASAEELGDWARRISPEAQLLAETFWPGPLTLVLPRTARASDLVTGGQDSVAVRVPANPVAHALLERAGIGIVAPSANRFGRVSATRAEHVAADLGDAVDLIVDGGPAAIGIESTIVSFIGKRPAILRPGGLTRERIEAVLGMPLEMAGADAVRVPGSLPSHYAPRARIELFEEAPAARRRAAELEGSGARAVLLDLAADVQSSARDLYDLLRRADAAGAAAIVVVLPPEGGLGSALRDRLRRAAARP